MKLKNAFQTPIRCAIAGSIFLHLILVTMYATLLSSKELAPTPQPAKKFKVEMVARKSEPIKKVPVIEKKIKQIEKVAPLKIRKPHTAYSAQKIRQTKIKMQAEPAMIPAKPKMVQENKIHSVKKSFQMAKDNISSHTVVSRQIKVVNVPVQENVTSKVQRPFKGRAKPVDISPLPRPVENVRTVSMLTGKETSFHSNAAGFAPSTPKPKLVSESSFSSNARKGVRLIRENRNIVSAGLPQARAIMVAKTQGSDQKKAVAFKRGASSMSINLPNIQKGTIASGLESVTTPNKVTAFYQTRSLAVAQLLIAEISSAPLPANIDTGNFRKVGFVQNGELIVAAMSPSPRPVPDIVDPRILDGYLGTLQKLIASAKQYPESARKSGHEGKVTVKFTVLKNGDVKNIQLLEKTNHRDLDEEAIAAVRRSAPFSDLPNEIGKSFLDIVLPFRFKLNE